MRKVKVTIGIPTIVEGWNEDFLMDHDRVEGIFYCDYDEDIKFKDKNSYVIYLEDNKGSKYWNVTPREDCGERSYALSMEIIKEYILPMELFEI